MNTVLIVSYNWPPDASVGAIRPVHLATALAKRGWTPIILTVKPESYEHVHEGQDTDLGRGFVIRTPCLPHPRGAYLSVKKLIASALGAREEFNESVRFNRGAEPLKDPLGSRKGILAKFKRLIVSLLYTPDQYLGWLPFAVPAAMRAIKKHHIRCVVTTGPPFTAHLIGLSLKRLCSVAWISDFRDPWSFNKQKIVGAQSPLADALNSRLEAMVVRSSDRVVSVTGSISQEYQRRYPSLEAKKWVTITNGFAPDEFRPYDTLPRSRRFTISYVGGFNYTRTPDMLIQALAEMLKEGLIARESLSVRFIGFCRYAHGRSVKEMAESAGLTDVIEIVDLLPRRDALREMRQAHVLLLLANEQEHQIPAKVYEYLGAGGHILAVTEGKGATADLVGTIGGCAVVEPGDVREMKRVLKAWYDDCGHGGTATCDRSFLEAAKVKAFEWGSLADQYAGVLEECQDTITR